MGEENLQPKIDLAEQRKDKLENTAIKDLQLGQGAPYGDLGGYAETLKDLYKEKLKGNDGVLTDEESRQLSDAEKKLGEKVDEAMQEVKKDLDDKDLKELKVRESTLAGIMSAFGEDVIAEAKKQVALAKANKNLEDEAQTSSGSFVAERDLQGPGDDIAGVAKVEEADGQKLDAFMQNFANNVGSRADLNTWLSNKENRDAIRQIIIGAKELGQEEKSFDINFDALENKFAAVDPNVDLKGAITKNISIGNLFTDDEIARISRVEPGNGRSPVDLTENDRFLTDDAKSDKEGTAFKRGLYKGDGSNFAYVAIFNGAKIKFGKELSKVSKVEADNTKFIASIERPSAVVGKAIAKKGDKQVPTEAVAKVDTPEISKEQIYKPAVDQVVNLMNYDFNDGWNSGQENSRNAFIDDIATICAEKGINPTEVNLVDMLPPKGTKIDYATIDDRGFSVSIEKRAAKNAATIKEIGEEMGVKIAAIRQKKSMEGEKAA